MLARARELGLDQGGRYAHLFDESHFFDTREAHEALERINRGSLIEQVPR
jgi:hypothetical protein